MGNSNSGRRPTPIGLKVLRGNPGKRPIGQAPTVPRADPTFDRPPRELAGDTVARAEWRRIVPVLRAAGLVSVTDRGALIACCQQWATYVAARAAVQEGGLVVRTKRGGTFPNSHLKIADRALAACVRLWSELGITPTGRAKAVKLPAADAPADAPPSKWAGLLP